MPSIAVLTAIVHAEVNERVKKEFPTEQLMDVQKMLRLGRKIVCIDNTLVALFVSIIGLLGCAGGYFYSDCPLAIFLFVGAVTLGVACLTIHRYKKSQKARVEMYALIASNPSYYNPIRSKIRTIFIESGGRSLLVD
jgi:hypothetical protein